MTAVDFFLWVAAICCAWFLLALCLGTTIALIRILRDKRDGK